MREGGGRSWPAGNASWSVSGWGGAASKERHTSNTPLVVKAANCCQRAALQPAGPPGYSPGLKMMAWHCGSSEQYAPRLGGGIDSAHSAISSLQVREWQEG